MGCKHLIEFRFLTKGVSLPNQPLSLGGRWKLAPQLRFSLQISLRTAKSHSGSAQNLTRPVRRRLRRQPAPPLTSRNGSTSLRASAWRASPRPRPTLRARRERDGVIRRRGRTGDGMALRSHFADERSCAERRNAPTATRASQGADMLSSVTANNATTIGRVKNISQL